ncbi:MAG: hypothetical protein J7518_20525 [Nocardioidaceae bacterium]|nr:hypothetical protein [Nocardioidaceae bacterium]
MSAARLSAVRRGAAVLVATLLAASVLTPVASAAAAAVTKERTVTRTAIAADGSSTQLDRRTVKLSVSATSNLRGRQEITVSWSGAHPTGGLVGDVNAAEGANQEYPFVLLQCRGVDSTSVPPAKRIRPETCWTQTWAERFRNDNTTAYPAWRSDADATAAERSARVNEASPRPKLCGRPALAERWVPLVGANGTTYAGGTVGCAGMAPESANVGGSGIPSNTTYGITGKDGRGSSRFSVWTAEENATLGCSSSVPCSLVAIPVMGIDCDGFGTRLPAAQRPDAEAGAQADADCRADDVFAPGQLALPGTRPNQATAGALWWAPSNWRNRISVPLGFAVAPSVCAIVSKAKPLQVYGSSLMNEATGQWQPKFCTDKALDPFVHVQTADTSARTLLQAGTISAAFSSRAPDGGFTRPVVQAPVAVTGFAIGYVVDDANGERYTQLRMNPRLLAKLLTESYPGNALVKNSYPALSGNPVNITLDPEFQALNPGLPEKTNTEAAAALLTLSSEADLVYALTSYLDQDPAARAWLDGAADPWGMVVNPKYKGLDLPVYSWPLLDDTLAPKSYIDGWTNPCYSNSPSPYLALIANPTAFVSTIVLNMQYAISNVNIECPNGDRNDPSTLRLQTQGRQQPGFRFVLGVVPLSAVSRYSLTAARLQAGPGSSAHPETASFVAGDDTGLAAGARLFHADAANKTWTVDYPALASARGKDAYPGTIPVFADVPTSGLAKDDAAKAAELLRFAATDGQRRGIANGQLPPGYLPITRANALGALAGYTLRAAKAVAAQQGFVPFLDPAQDPKPAVVAKPPAGAGPGAVPGSVPGAVPAAVPGAPAGAPVTLAGVPVTDQLRTLGAHSALGYGVPVIGFAGLVIGLAGAVLRWAPRKVRR